MTSKVPYNPPTHRHTCAQLAVRQQRTPRCKDCPGHEKKHEHSPVTTWGYQADKYMAQIFNEVKI